MATMHKHPSSQPNMPAVARILSAYDRKSLEAFLSVALDLLDTMDGDADLEDGTDAEDDFALSAIALQFADSGPGCTIGDPGGGNVEDEAQIWEVESLSPIMR